MRKIRRNDKCPCESGKKYKKCCLDKNQEDNQSIILPEIASILHARCIQENLFINNSTMVNFLSLFNEICNKNKVDIHNIDDNDVFFKILEKNIEEHIINICSKYTSYELFFWHRRIHPVKDSNFSSSTFFSRYELLKKTILMFGTKKDVFTSIEHNTLSFFVPDYIKHLNHQNVFVEEIPEIVIQVLSDIYKLEGLCLFFIHIRNNKRVASKGGTIIPDHQFGFTTKVDDPDLKYLINLFDDRSNSQTLLTAIGGYSDEDKENHDKFVLFSLQPNFDKRKQEVFKRLKFKYKEDTTNFFAYAFGFSDYYLYLKELNPIIMIKYGFRIEEFLSIILYFSSSMGSTFNYLINELDDDYELSAAIHLLQRGYLLIDNDDQNIRGYFDCFYNTYNEYFSNCGKPVYKKFKAAYDFLFYQTGNYQNLENELLNHSLFIRITKDKILVDCTSLNMILTSFLEGFKSLDGEYANKISESYEKIINEKIISIFGKESHFHKGELTNEKGEKKEIDASFIIDDVLFLIECKSLSVSQGSILGEYGAIEFRKKKLLGYLKEIEDKAKFIKNSKSLSMQIPEKVRYIVPIVSTSYPEFIWENNEQLFIYNAIPRFVTIKELDKLKNLEIINSIKLKPYTIKLHDEVETVYGV